MKRLGIIFFVIAALAAVSYWRVHSQRQLLEEAFAGDRRIILWSSTAQVREVVTTLNFGERVQVLDHQGDASRVQTAQGVTGWVLNSHQLLDSTLWHRAMQLVEQSQGMPVQARGHTKVLSNLRLEPGRLAQRFMQLGRDVPLEILARRVANVPQNSQGEKDEQTLDKQEDWLFVRGKVKDFGEVAGWALGRFLDLDLPDPLPAYANAAGMRTTGWFELNHVAGDGGVAMPQYLVIGTKGAEGQDCDFTMIRVFTWGAGRHRYETAYLESDICGVLPVLVTPATKPGGDATFQFTNLKLRGKETRVYRMHQTIVRRMRDMQTSSKRRTR
jgi:Bacterial SH3 domain